jgi:hypothetical protein
MKLTEAQIALIDKALVKAGIRYVDVRMELTDHVAAILEQKDERFEHHLKGYILQHKKELKALNRKFIAIAMLKVYKQLFIRMLSPLFLLVTAIAFGAVYVINTVFERAVTILVLFLIYTGICCLIKSLSGFSMIDATFNRKKQYSYSFGFSFIYLLLFYPTLQVFINQDSLSDMILMVYFTIAIALSFAMYTTVRKFNKKYKLKYHG